ncbi:MAG: ACT domain-containing protein, partial [Acidimicrobiales bacterium]
MNETRPERTILIRVSGPDRPGITAALMDLLATHRCRIDDVEQISIRGQLVLGLVVALPDGVDLRADLLLLGYEHEVGVDFEDVPAIPTPRRPALVATILDHTVAPTEFAAIAAVVASNGGNLDRIVRLAKYPVMAYELTISAEDTEP